MIQKRNFTAQRVWKATEEDGLSYILAGLMLLISPMIVSRPHHIWMFGLAIIFGPILLSRFKEKVTYPRVGYAVLLGPKNTKKDWGGVIFVIGSIIGWVALVLLLGGASDTLLWYRWVPTVVALLLTGMFMSLVKKSGQKAWLLLAGFSLAGAVAISFIDFQTKFDWITLYCIGLGTVFLILGITRLLFFIRKYPVVVEVEANGE